jgi:hypothetical protein
MKLNIDFNQWSKLNNDNWIQINKLTNSKYYKLLSFLSEHIYKTFDINFYYKNVNYNKCKIISVDENSFLVKINNFPGHGINNNCWWISNKISFFINIKDNYII